MVVATQALPTTNYALLIFAQLLETLDELPLPHNCEELESIEFGRGFDFAAFPIWIPDQFARKHFQVDLPIGRRYHDGER